ncbi:MAG TPA: gamma-glutamyltransferase [Actinomycetes bacterium]|nr:gamma-glutamyltransferase [Actinomycetes bacterium]
MAVAEGGGNAVDAAVAAAMSLAVVYPHMCSAGGDVIALVACPDGHVECVNASGAAGIRANAGAVAREHGMMPVSGPHTVTVPGAVSAWGVLSERAGRLSLGELLEPAVAQARDGVPIAPGVHRALLERADLLSLDPGMREVFFCGGAPIGEGEPLRQPALAATLAEIADFGWRAFYDGPVARRVASGLIRLGVQLVPVDLARHAPEVTAPLRSRHQAGEILTAPPNSQGLLLAEILGALERLDPRDPLGADAGALAELFRLVSRDRDRYLGDPRWTAVPVEELLGPANAQRLADAARHRAAGRSLTSGGAAARVAAPHATPVPRAAGDTVAVVAMDAEGYAVSLIQSVFHAFGSGLLDSETGLIFHNRGAFFSLDPSSPNRLEPGKRPAHTLMPVLAREAGRIVGAYGTMGGKAQPQIHTHLLLNLEAGRSPAETLAAPRWVLGGLVTEEGDVVLAERSVPPAALEAISAAGLGIMALGDLDEEVGHGQLVRRTSTGELLAATDPRSDGQAAAR